MLYRIFLIISIVLWIGGQATLFADDISPLITILLVAPIAGVGLGHAILELREGIL
jgi:multisubunit Na+/H+ antiporter MnhG subunit